MKRTIATIAAATAMFASSAAAELPAEKMSLAEDIAYECGAYGQMIRDVGGAPVGVEAKFLSEARSQGASSYQLEVLRTRWAMGEAKAASTNTRGEPTQEQINSFSDMCGKLF